MANSPQMLRIFELYRAKLNRGMPDGQLRTWERMFGHLDLDMLNAACERLEARQTYGKLEPADLLKELPSEAMPETPKVDLRWWEWWGDWGGDWSKADRRNVLAVACAMVRHEDKNGHERRRDEFIAMARRRHFGIDVINEGAAMILNDFSLPPDEWLDRVCNPPRPAESLL